MIEKRYGTLKGLELPVLVYESIDEVEKVKPGGVLEECNANLAYRGPLNEGREIICGLLEAETGIERIKKDSGRKDKEGKPILVEEADGEYASRVCAQKGWDDLKFLQPKVDEACRTRVEVDDEGKPKLDSNGHTIPDPLAVDVTQRVRKGPPAKLAQRYIDNAKKILSGGKVDKFIVAVKEEAGQTVTLVGDEAKDIDTVARAIKALCEARERKALETLPGVA